MIQDWTSHKWYGHQVTTLSVKVDPGKRRSFVVLLKEWYYRCLSIFYLLPFHTWGTLKVQFLDKTDNFLTYFKWVKADEEFSTCINVINWSMRCNWSWLDVGCLDDILLVAILDNLQQISEELEHRRKQLKNCYALLFVGWASTRISFIPEVSHSCKFLTHFKWLNAREEVYMKGFSYHSSACPV